MCIELLFSVLESNTKNMNQLKHCIRFLYGQQLHSVFIMRNMMMQWLQILHLLFQPPFCIQGVKQLSLLEVIIS